MENKYYVPHISEFHVGFEYEYYNGSEWGPFIFDGLDDTDYNELCYLDIYVVKEKVRVKYLDKEDIESLGFKFDESSSDLKTGYLKFELSGYTLELVIYYVAFKEQNKKFTSLRINKQSIVDSEKYTTLFNGIIKNKSELKKVLEMLGI
jgi:hypothetical protein